MYLPKSARFMAASTLLFLSLSGAAATEPAVDHTPPSAPTNLQAWWVEPDHVYLRWAQSRDDVGVTAYRLYRNEELVATTLKTYFLDMEYEREILNGYHVTAVDAAGNESEPSEFIASPANSSGGL